MEIIQFLIFSWKLTQIAEAGGGAEADWTSHDERTSK